MGIQLERPVMVPADRGAKKMDGDGGKVDRCACEMNCGITKKEDIKMGPGAMKWVLVSGHDSS